MSKRWLAVGAGLLLTVTTACSGGGDAGEGGGGAAGEGEAAAGPVTLRYALWNPDQAPVMEELAAAFEEDNPNVDVQVEVTPFDQYWTALQTAATGGAAPDVFWMNGPNFPLYASNGVIAPIDEQIQDSELDTSVYPEALMELYSYDGQQYALPKDFDTIGLWYNRELFDAAGVPYPDETWTWETLQDAACRLTDPAKGVHGVAARFDRQENYYNTIFQAGGRS
jgi:multiple sugar transport system substrate-binding protein